MQIRLGGPAGVPSLPVEGSGQLTRVKQPSDAAEDICVKELATEGLAPSPPPIQGNHSVSLQSHPPKEGSNPNPTGEHPSIPVGVLALYPRMKAAENTDIQELRRVIEGEIPKAAQEILKARLKGDPSVIKPMEDKGLDKSDEEDIIKMVQESPEKVVSDQVLKDISRMTFVLKGDNDSVLMEFDHATSQGTGKTEEGIREDFQSNFRQIFTTPEASVRAGGVIQQAVLTNEMSLMNKMGISGKDINKSFTVSVNGKFAIIEMKATFSGRSFSGPVMGNILTRKFVRRIEIDRETGEVIQGKDWISRTDEFEPFGAYAHLESGLIPEDQLPGELRAKANKASKLLEPQLKFLGASLEGIRGYLGTSRATPTEESVGWEYTPATTLEYYAYRNLADGQLELKDKEMTLVIPLTDQDSLRLLTQCQKSKERIQVFKGVEVKSLEMTSEGVKVVIRKTGFLSSLSGILRRRVSPMKDDLPLDWSAVVPKPVQASKTFFQRLFSWKRNPIERPASTTGIPVVSLEEVAKTAGLQNTDKAATDSLKDFMISYGGKDADEVSKIDASTPNEVITEEIKGDLIRGHWELQPLSGQVLQSNLVRPEGVIRDSKEDLVEKFKGLWLRMFPNHPKLARQYVQVFQQGNTEDTFGPIMQQYNPKDASGDLIEDKTLITMSGGSKQTIVREQPNSVSVRMRNHVPAVLKFNGLNIQGLEGARINIFDVEETREVILGKGVQRDGPHILADGSKTRKKWSSLGVVICNELAANVPKANKKSLDPLMKDVKRELKEAQRDLAPKLKFIGASKANDVFTLLKACDSYEEAKDKAAYLLYRSLGDNRFEMTADGKSAKIVVSNMDASEIEGDIWTAAGYQAVGIPMPDGSVEYTLTKTSPQKKT